MVKGKGKAREKQATDADLFVVDEAGDETLRRQLQSSTWDNPAAANARKGSGKPLKSTEILAQRSRVPGRTSKVQPGAMVKYKLEREKRMKITPEVKKRLRSMAKRNEGGNKDLWNVAAAGGANLERADVKNAGEYDMWASTSHEVAVKKPVPEDIVDIVTHVPPKPPMSLYKHQMLDSTATPKAIALPHPGESYNPAYDDHQAILAAEHAKALAEEQAAERQAAMKNQIMQGREDNQDARETGYADEVGSGDEDEDQEERIEGETAEEKKTRKQRRKSDKERKRRQANLQLEAEMRARNRLTKAQRQALSSLSVINKDLQGSSSISLSQLHKRKTELAARLASSGLAEMKSGPSRVPKPKQSYLLTDELPEGLRQLKTNGNLWNEWLDSSRRRGKVQMERNTMPGMRKLKGRSLKEKEKVAWRKWDLGI